MNFRVFRRTLFYSCWLPILGMGVAVSFQAARITGRPPEYIASGKIMAGMQPPDGKPQSVPADFYGTQIELLQSGSLRANAKDRVRGLHPELKEADVDTIVIQTPGSSILNVVATGSERQYTRTYLDAVLDEYMAMRKRILEATLTGASNKVIEEVLAREKVVNAAKTKFEAFVAASDSLELLTAEKSRLSQLVSQLRGEMEALKAPGSPSDSGTATRIESMQARLKAAESSLRDVNEKSAEGDALKSDYDRAKKDHEAWKMKLEQLSLVGVMCGEPVAIMERPIDAYESPPELWLPILAAAVMGFTGGLVLMLAISLIAAYTISSRPNQPPPLA
jgi:hypothetical protein